MLGSLEARFSYPGLRRAENIFSTSLIGGVTVPLLSGLLDFTNEHGTLADENSAGPIHSAMSVAKLPWLITFSEPRSASDTDV